MSASVIRFDPKAPDKSGEVSTFHFGDKPIRVINRDGEPWFVAADVCRATNLYVKPNGKVHASQAFDFLEESEKESHRIVTLGGPQKLIIISESGLYKFAFRSHPKSNEAAREFQNWVAMSVLPAIRKDGGYIRGEEKIVTGEMTEDELLLKAFTVLKTKVERLTAERDELAAELNNVTVDELRALRHEYWPLSFKQRLGQVASMLATKKGITLEKQPRMVPTKAGMKESAVNVYPRALLEEALEFMGTKGTA